jgi:dihydrolipoamide dehydrogenase
MIMGAKSGIVKLVTDEATGEILGAQLFAPRATDMIAELCVAMKCEGTIEELAATIHPHPTVSEVIMEAAHDVEGLCCHSMPKVKNIWEKREVQ